MSSKPTILVAKPRRLRLALALPASAGLLTLATTLCVPALPAGASRVLPSLSHIGGSLTVWSEWTGVEQQYFEAAISPFEAETGVNVLYRGNSSNEATVVEAAVAGGRGPNVAFVPQPAVLDILASKHELTPVSSVIGSEAADYGSAWNTLASYDGKLYGVWYKAANKNTIWYNPAEFAAAGISSPPASWQQLLTDAATLKAAGVTPFSLCGDIGWPVADLWQNIYLKANGATDYELLAQHKIKWTNPTVTEAFDILAQLVGQPSYLLGGTAGALGTGGDYPSCVDQVFPKPGATPAAAMVAEGDFVVSEITGNSANYQAGTTYPDGKKCTADPSGTPCYDFFPFPALASDEANNGTIQVAGDVALLINPTPQAKAFLQYIASPEPAEIWAHLGGYASPNKLVPLSSYPDAVTRADAAELASASESVFSLDDEQGSWEPELWQDMLNFVKDPSPSNITTVQSTMEQQASAAMGH